MLDTKGVRLVNHTYFQKAIQKSIDDIKIGDLVFIKIRSPLHYGNRELIYYGRIAKITKCFFWITEYAMANWTTSTYCNSSSIAKYDANPEHYTKQWAKSRLLEIWSATSKEKVEKVPIYSTT